MAFNVKTGPQSSAFVAKINLCPVYSWKVQFRYECERLKTFETWPLKWLDVKKLALTGMFYTGLEDRTKCFFCDVVIGKWEYGDDPVKEHLRWSPNCPLLGRRLTNNVPCNADILNEVLPSVGQNTCGHLSLGSMKLKEETDYSLENVRLATYGDWPSSIRQKPEQLAEAGFYYSGVGDRVVCFVCNVTLKDWVPDDDPWEQHALWKPDCAYVKLVKGSSYIEKVMNTLEKSVEEPKSTFSSAASSSELDEDKLCKICFENERHIAYVPCGHVVSCSKCTFCTKECPICRTPISKVIRLFFS